MRITRGVVVSLLSVLGFFFWSVLLVDAARGEADDLDALTQRCNECHQLAYAPLRVYVSVDGAVVSGGLL
jgi:hypothetical protein